MNHGKHFFIEGLKCKMCGKSEFVSYGSVNGVKRVRCTNCGRRVLYNLDDGGFLVLHGEEAKPAEDFKASFPEFEKPDLINYRGLATSLLDSLKNRNDLVRIPPKSKIFTGKLEEEAVLLISDIHAGKTNSYLDPDTGVMEVTYNQDKMVSEFNRLLDAIYGINALLSHGYSIKKLNIFGLGDWVDNNMIFKGQEFFIEYGVGKQITVLVNLLAKFIEACLTMFGEIELSVIGGNHGRFTPKRTAAPAYNNFDYLVGKMLQLLFEKEPRVKIVVAESWYLVKKIFDWRYFIHHGDTVYSWMSLPYYGIVRQSKSRRIEVPHDIECIGHFHQKMEIPLSSHTFTMVNGGWIEKEDFGWHKFGNLTRPEQWYFGVSPKRPRTWQFPLDLLHAKSEWDFDAPYTEIVI